MDKIQIELKTAAIKWSKKISKDLNNFEKLSEYKKNLTWLLKAVPVKRQKPGQKKSDFKGANEFDYKKLTKKEKDGLRKEYVDLISIIKQIKKIRRLKKEIPAPLKENFSQKELSLIKFDSAPHKSALIIWQSRHPFLADSLSSFQRRFPQK